MCSDLLKFSSLPALILIFFFVSCKQSSEPADQSPRVEILVPAAGDTVSGIVSVTIDANDDGRIDLLELLVDQVMIFDTTGSKKQLQWDTRLWQNGPHGLKVRVTDNAQNKATSETVPVFLDNSMYTPDEVQILSIYYRPGKMQITWNSSRDSNFVAYQLQRSTAETGTRESLGIFSNPKDTVAILTDFNPAIETWYWIRVTNRDGYHQDSDSYRVKDSAPEKISIYQSNFFQGELTLKWSLNHDQDFASYVLYESISGNWSDKNIIFESSNRSDLTYIVSGMAFDSFRYYQIGVLDIWGQETLSLIHRASSYSKICYHRGRGYASTYWLMDIDGQNQYQLTEIYDNYSLFRLSPDGRFGVITNGQDIFTIRDDGAGFTNVTNHPEQENRDPAWSPDGQQIVYAALDGWEHDIWLMNRNGANKTEIVSNQNDRDKEPLFTPDGQFIIFESLIQASFEICSVKPNGGDFRQLNNSFMHDERHPVVSPDGLKILYESNLNSASDYYSMNLDGTGKRRITYEGQHVFDGAWSPNSQSIVFVSERSDDNEIIRISADGSNPVNLSNNPADDGAPVFSSGGQWIYFHSNRNGNYDIYRINVDGSGLIQLTSTNKDERFPVVQPR